MRAAIIGSGLIADSHLRAIRELGHDAVLVINPRIESAEAFAEKWGIREAGRDFSDAFRSGIDCVHICTPPAFHFQIVREALLAGKNVICEKPLCFDAAEASELYSLARKSGSVCAVDFNVRFHEAVQRAKKMISAGRLGRLCLVHGSYLQEFHALPDAYTWRYKAGPAGKMRAVTEIGSHFFDLVRFLTGYEITEVSATFGSFTPKRFVHDGIMYEEPAGKSEEISVDTEDSAAVTFRLSNGALGNVLLSEISHGRGNALMIEAEGTQASLWWNSENPYTLMTGRKSEGSTAETNAFGGGFSDTFRLLFAEVYKDISCGKASALPSYPTLADGMMNAAVCEAVFRSARNNSAWEKVQASF